jgi:lycopene cyclase domain-containing protein
MDKYYYLLINIFTISVPLIRGFEPRIRFFSRWKGLLLGLIAAGIPFIIWDVIFTAKGIWGFNETYLTGFKLINLPIEEWLFFITVPVACIFIYEVLILFVKKDILAPMAYPITYALIVILFVFGFLNIKLAYTAVTFLLTAAYLLFIVVFTKPDYLGRFYLGYLVSLFPFIIVNGILTGSFIPDEIVWYNDSGNLSVRLFTIPIEDTVYMLLLLIINTSVYEWWKNRTNVTTF